MQTWKAKESWESWSSPIQFNVTFTCTDGKEDRFPQIFKSNLTRFAFENVVAGPLPAEREAAVARMLLRGDFLTTFQGEANDPCSIVGALPR